MLKIKDNVDLKELKKFGFTLWNRYTLYRVINDNNNLGISIDRKSKYISFYNRLVITQKTYKVQLFQVRDLLDTLYDLIKADLVEKVDD